MNWWTFGCNTGESCYAVFLLLNLLGRRCVGYRVRFHYSGIAAWYAISKSLFALVRCRIEKINLVSSGDLKHSSRSFWSSQTSWKPKHFFMIQEANLYKVLVSYNCTGSNTISSCLLGMVLIPKINNRREAPCSTCEDKTDKLPSPLTHYSPS